MKSVVCALLEEPLMGFNPVLAKLLGVKAAVILEQIQLWTTGEDATTDEAGIQWMIQSHAQWQERLPFLDQNVRERLMAGLERQGIVVRKRQRDERLGWRANAYRIDEKRLAEVLVGAKSAK